MWAEQVELIKGVLESIPLVQDDLNWTCRVWLQQALRVLREQGGDFATIPHIGIGGQVKNAVLSSGNEAMEILKGRKGIIRQPGDFPQRDMRLAPSTRSVPPGPLLSGINSPCNSNIYIESIGDVSR